MGTNIVITATRFVGGEGWFQSELIGDRCLAQHEANVKNSAELEFEAANAENYFREFFEARGTSLREWASKALTVTAPKGVNHYGVTLHVHVKNGRKFKNFDAAVLRVERAFTIMWYEEKLKAA